MKSDRVIPKRSAADRRRFLLGLPTLAAGIAWNGVAAQSSQTNPDVIFPASVTHYRTKEIDGVKIFYREAGPEAGPILLLLHGFPSSSHMFRNLIPALADRYRVIALDYPGYGQSDMPDRAKFTYTFDRFAELVGGLLDQLGVARYANMARP